MELVKQEKNRHC